MFAGDAYKKSGMRVSIFIFCFPGKALRANTGIMRC
jgi:hypothetical protein